MTKAIGTAHVPHTITVDRETTEPITRHLIDLAPELEAMLPVEVHPSWCVNADLFTTHGVNIPCGDHLGECANIVATDSDFEVCDLGALFPRIEVSAATKGDVLTVNVTLINSVNKNDRDRHWVATNLRPADARKLAVYLAPLGQGARGADLAGVELTASATGLDGSVRAVTDGGSVRLTIIDDQALTIEAFLKPDESDHMVSALIRAADVVEGR
jgi:hypothetical protein